MPGFQTVLTLDGMGIVPYSTRGAVQTLDYYEGAAANIYTDVNGVTRVAGGTQFQKYKSNISCSDQRPIAADGVWPGKIVTVGCIAELAYRTSEGPPSRTPVEGSEVVDTGSDYTIYRPLLTMMVMNLSIQKNEWGAEVGWSMDLLEVQAP